MEVVSCRCVSTTCEDAASSRAVSAGARIGMQPLAGHCPVIRPPVVIAITVYMACATKRQQCNKHSEQSML